jgi:ABC exporter DevB family membrane fusion protein
MLRKALIGLILVSGLTAAGAYSASRCTEPDVKSAAAPVIELVAGPGRVEPASEEIALCASAAGTLKAVLVDEGDMLSAGQVVAVLEDSQQQASVQIAEARRAHAEAALARLRSGARPQEREAAQAEVDEALAVMRSAQTQLERRQKLRERNVVTQEDIEAVRRDYEVALRRHKAAAERHSLVVAPPREEDVAQAEADVRLAQAQQAEARAALHKTRVHSPLGGMVLRRHRQPGELVLDSPDWPVLTIGDLSSRRVRVEIDEADVGRLWLGQPAYVTAPAYPGQQFTGRVVQIGRTMGQKQIRTDNPAERIDVQILEVLVELDDGAELPMGLRVDAFLHAQRRS